MYGLFNASTVVSIFMAAVLAFELAPYLGLASKQAALAVRLAAVALTIEAVWGFLQMPLSGLIYSLPMGGWLFHEFPRVAFAAFWGCLAWAALALSQLSGPQVRR
jgi:predicted cation transporter